MRRRPRLIEFMFKGVPAAEAVDLLDRWDTLTDAEIEALGFTAASSREAMQSSPFAPQSVH